MIPEKAVKTKCLLTPDNKMMLSSMKEEDHNCVLQQSQSLLVWFHFLRLDPFPLKLKIIFFMFLLPPNTIKNKAVGTQILWYGFPLFVMSNSLHQDPVLERKHFPANGWDSSCLWCGAGSLQLCSDVNSLRARDEETSHHQSNKRCDVCQHGVLHDTASAPSDEVSLLSWLAQFEWWQLSTALISTNMKTSCFRKTSLQRTMLFDTLGLNLWKYSLTQTFSQKCDTSNEINPWPTAKSLSIIK